MLVLGGQWLTQSLYTCRFISTKLLMNTNIISKCYYEHLKRILSVTVFIKEVLN